MSVPGSLHSSIPTFNQTAKAAICTIESLQTRIENGAENRYNQISRIRHYEQFQRLHETFRRRIRYIEPFQRFAKRISGLIPPITASWNEFSFTIADASSHNGAAENKNLASHLIIIDENGIPADAFVDFLSLFQGLDPHHQPKIAIRPNHNISELPSQLQSLSDNLELEFLGDIRSVQPSKPSSGESENPSSFFQRFLHNAHGENLSFNSHQNILASPFEAGKEDILTAIGVELLRIKTFDHVGRKFEAAKPIQHLFQNLDQIRERNLGQEFMNYILAAKAILSLWYAYIFEEHAALVGSARQISEHLSDDTLTAHADRLGHLLHGPTPEAKQRAENAADCFAGHGILEQYVYARNNSLLTDYHIDRLPLKGFRDLCAYAEDDLPFLARLAVIFNNAGVVYMMDGRYDDALEYLARARSCSGQQIHHLGVRCNQLLVRYMAGERLVEDEIYSIFAAIDRSRLPPRYDYHQTILYWNLIKFSEVDHRDLKADICAHLRKCRFLPYDDVLDGKIPMHAFLTQYLPSGKFGTDRPGYEISFAKRHDIFPITHFQWM